MYASQARCCSASSHPPSGTGAPPLALRDISPILSAEHHLRAAPLPFSRGRQEQEVPMPYAAVLTGYGSPETLVWSEVALPTPGPGQIRMRVHAAGVGPTDLKIRRGELREV